MKALLVTAALAACAPTVRLAGRCPTTPNYAVDFAIAAVGLAASVIAYNEGRELEAVAWGSGGMLVALGANLAECRK